MQESGIIAVQLLLQKAEKEVGLRNAHYYCPGCLRCLYFPHPNNRLTVGCPDHIDDHVTHS
jgi:hypothetical protein